VNYKKLLILQFFSVYATSVVLRTLGLQQMENATHLAYSCTCLFLH